MKYFSSAHGLLYLQVLTLLFFLSHPPLLVPCTLRLVLSLPSPSVGLHVLPIFLSQSPLLTHNFGDVSQCRVVVSPGLIFSLSNIVYARTCVFVCGSESPRTCPGVPVLSEGAHTTFMACCSINVQAQASCSTFMQLRGKLDSLPALMA